jgi:hypothetical protein
MHCCFTNTYNFIFFENMKISIFGAMSKLQKLIARVFKKGSGSEWIT